MFGGRKALTGALSRRSAGEVQISWAPTAKAGDISNEDHMMREERKRDRDQVSYMYHTRPLQHRTRLHLEFFDSSMMQHQLHYELHVNSPP